MRKFRETPWLDARKDRELDREIAERFNAERHPEKLVDGDDEMDLYDTPEDELPGMWERADFMGGES